MGFDESSKFVILMHFAESESEDGKKIFAKNEFRSKCGSEIESRQNHAWSPYFIAKDILLQLKDLSLDHSTVGRCESTSTMDS